MRKLTTDDGFTLYYDSEDASLIEPWTWTTERHRSSHTTRTQVGKHEGKRIAVARRQRFHFYAHRMISGGGPDQIVRHLNGDGLDNRKNNLTVDGVACFGQTGKSQYRGVAWDEYAQKWRVTLGLVNGRTVNLTRHVNELEAAIAYDKAARERFGEFARLNFEGSTKLPS